MATKKEQALKQVELIQTYKRVFNDSEDGFKILIDLMRNFNMLRSSYDGKVADNLVVFNEGQRNVILYILSKVNMDENKLYEIIRRIEEQK